jgi:N-dimethylarginine dimethylaminohydrolase
MNKILVHNNWDPLEEIWLGDVWPEHFYDDLEPELRDAFYQITEWTKQDLNNIQSKLEEFNVVVRRPVVSGDKSKFIDSITGKLIKPPICPRDYLAVIGENLYFGNEIVHECFKPLLDLYPSENILYKNLSGSNIVKLGKDIIIDNAHSTRTSEAIYQWVEDFENKHSLLLDNYRIHFATNGGHIDGCFMPLKEGLLLATKYWTTYDMNFPNWKRIELQNPTYSGTKWDNPWFGRWQISGLKTPPHFNQYLETYCKDWIGNYKETYFEVNVVMIDEKNMLCMGHHEELFRDLEKEGITCHVIPFRTRAFWDGGLHCITLDIRRRTVMKDYFPERGKMGLSSFIDKIFPDLNYFLKKYNAWKENKKD